MVPRAPLELPLHQEIECELGCGNGLFLVQLAQQFPSHFFVGIDIRDEFMEDGRKQVAALHLTNLRFEKANLIIDHPQLFPANSVHRFFINFPDPWFKERQHNRRWLTIESATSLVRALRSDGMIFFQSDVWSNSLEALYLLELQPALKNTEGEWTFLRRNPLPAQTTREQHCLEDGKAIWRMQFQKLTNPLV